MNPELIKPTFDRILVKKQREEKIGLIYVPLTAEDENTLRVIIVALGPEANTDTTGSVNMIGQQFEVGQQAIINKYAGVEMNKDSGFYLVNRNDILATLD